MKMAKIMINTRYGRKAPYAWRRLCAQIVGDLGTSERADSDNWFEGFARESHKKFVTSGEGEIID
jgi:hypothetical protein